MVGDGPLDALAEPLLEGGEVRSNARLPLLERGGHAGLHAPQRLEARAGLAEQRARLVALGRVGHRRPQVCGGTPLRWAAVRLASKSHAATWRVGERPGVSGVRQAEHSKFDGASMSS